MRYTQGAESMAVARYTLAVDRGTRKNGEKTADFISCVAFGKSAEFAEKYLKKGAKIAIVGHIQTGSYTNKEGRKIYTTDVVIENQEFAQSREADLEPQDTFKPKADDDGFMKIPNGIDEELPFG